ncbi:hypothetical protein BH23ACT9_BH23ACT9_01760 [soil metagenome]
MLLPFADEIFVFDAEPITEPEVIIAVQQAALGNGCATG